MGGQLGDYVIGQAGMENIMQQLLEQAQAAGGGAQPARPEVVQALPRLEMTAEMIGWSN